MTSKQADGRFLYGILVALILATLASGTVAAIAMVSTAAAPGPAGIAAQR